MAAVSKIINIAGQGQDKKRVEFPTVLVVARDEELRQHLAQSLSEDVCLVLTADTGARAIYHMVHHSRPIHVLLVGIKMGPVVLARTLRLYRPNLHIVSVTADLKAAQGNILLPDAALLKVRELLGSIGIKRDPALRSRVAC